MATRNSTGDSGAESRAKKAAPAATSSDVEPAAERKADMTLPFPGLAAFPALREEMQRMMRPFFDNDWMQDMSRLHPMMMDWPAMTRAMPFAAMGATAKAAMSESDTEYEITVELPGMDEKDVELTLGDGTLLLKAEKTDERKGEEKDYHFTERSYGSIRRRFPLPPGVDAEGMKASFSKGVLTVKLPKTETAKRTPRRIPVSGD